MIRLRQLVAASAFLTLAGLPAWSQQTAQQPPTQFNAASTQPPSPPPSPPMMGSINYIEGQASLDGTPLTPSSVGHAVLQTNQVLNTQTGRVEMLLNPGVFLRLDNNSVVRMVSPDLANTRIQVERGRAFVEVLNIRDENDIRVDVNGSTTRILKRGLYDFDAGHAQVRVFKGKAETTIGNEKVKLGDHHQVSLMAGVKLKSQDFDEKNAQDDFYRWNSLRSGYLSEASVSAARAYMGANPDSYGPGWNGLGWYWDPYFSAYTFLPGSGIFWDPFGWGFYPPFAVYRSPYFYHPGITHRFGDFHYPYGHGIARGAGGFRGGGFRGGARGGRR